MAGDWIKVETVTPGKPEVHAIADICGITPEHALGCLVCLWIWADQQTLDGNARSVTKTLLDRYTRVTGFADAMIRVGWLEEKDGDLTFPNFGIHNGSSAKRRAQTLKRVQKTREKQHFADDSKKVKKRNASNVTKALPETEKREEIEIEKKEQDPLPPKTIDGTKETWEIPEDLDSPEVRQALEDFRKMRIKIRKPIKDLKNASRILKQFSDKEHLLRAIDHVIGNEYQGLKPEYGMVNSKVNGKRKSEDVFDKMLRDLEESGK